MKTRTGTIALLLAVPLGLLTLPGCERDDEGFEDAGREIDEAIDDAERGADDLQREAGEQIEGIGDELQEDDSE